MKFVNIYENRFNLSQILTYFIIVSFVMLIARNIFLELSLFVISLIYMFKIGTNLFLDTDPVQFFSFFILYLSDPLSAIYFLMFALPVVDILVGRFSYYSFINLVPAFAVLLVFGYILPTPWIVTFGVLGYNLIRIILYNFLKLGPQNTLTAIGHSGLYFVIGSIITFFV